MLKQNDKRLENIKKLIALGYPQQEDYIFEYTSDFEKSSFSQSHIKQFLDDGYRDFGFFTYCCEDLTKYSLYRALYASKVLGNMKLMANEFSRAAYYGYMGIHIGASGCGLDIEYKPFLEMNVATELFIASILINDWDKADRMYNDLTDSLNADSCIIARGQSELSSHPLWFTLKIYSKILNVPIHNRKPYHPKGFDIYEEVLEKWNTTDLLEVDKMIFLLTDMHYEVYRYDKNAKTFLVTFPLEIIAWLKLRERCGLSNPTAFTHPFLKQKCIKYILKTKEQYSVPSKLPFANSLINGLRKEYDDLDLSSWIDSTTMD